MGYEIGKDPETNELLIADNVTRSVLCRGPLSEEVDIRQMVHLANKAGKLQAIVNQLPKCWRLLDGKLVQDVPITFGGRLWAVQANTNDELDPDNSFAGWITVRGMEPPYPADSQRWLIIPTDTTDGCCFNDECYSTKAAADAAKD